MTYYYGGSERHPGCPGGCGMLADECECRFVNPLGSMRIVEPVKVADVYADDDLTGSLPACRWRRCTEDAAHGGYCEIHLDTL